MNYRWEREMEMQPPTLSGDIDTLSNPEITIRESVRRPVNKEIKTLCANNINEGITKAVVEFAVPYEINLIFSKELYEKLEKKKPQGYYSSMFDLIKTKFSYCTNICYCSTMKRNTFVLNNNPTGEEVAVSLVRKPVNKFELGFDG